MDKRNKFTSPGRHVTVYHVSPSTRKTFERFLKAVQTPFKQYFMPKKNGFRPYIFSKYKLYIHKYRLCIFINISYIYKDTSCIYRI